MSVKIKDHLPYLPTIYEYYCLFCRLVFVLTSSYRMWQYRYCCSYCFMKRSNEEFVSCNLSDCIIHHAFNMRITREMNMKMKTKEKIDYTQKHAWLHVIFIIFAEPCFINRFKEFSQEENFQLKNRSCGGEHAINKINFDNFINYFQCIITLYWKQLLQTWNGRQNW